VFSPQLQEVRLMKRFVLGVGVGLVLGIASVDIALAFLVHVPDLERHATARSPLS
jgi:hypothetical protein